jgi:dihydroneopterin aldolase
MPQSPKLWTLSLRNICLDMSIGIDDHELTQNQNIILNLKCTYEMPLAVTNDPEEVVCYAGLLGNIKAKAGEGHIYFLETFAQTIANECFKDERIHRVWVSLEKPNLFGQGQGAAIEIERLRDNPS